MKYDLIIKNGKIVDGTGRRAFFSDILISDGKIAKIEENTKEEALSYFDAKGKVVAPGFVDIHSHSDICPLLSYLPESKIYQGVTSELCGNCGISILPCSEEKQEEIKKYCSSELEIPMLDTKITTGSVKEYADFIKENGVSGNYGMLIGHGTLRGFIMGFENRKPSEEEFQAMEKRLDEEMAAGAYGMSLGLAYPPSCFSEIEELKRLAKVVAKYDGIVAVHLRDECAKVLDSVQEMIEIARDTGVHVQISHLKIMQTPNWHFYPEEIAMIDAANKEGLHITCDQYPYTASALALSAFLPHWAHDGGLEAMMQKISNPTKELLEEMEQKLIGRGGRDGIMICSTRGVREDWEGKMIGEISDSLGMDYLNGVLEIIKTCGPDVFVTTFAQDIKVVTSIFQREDIAIGSDGYGLSYDPAITKDKLHIRNFSTYPHAIEWAREENLLPLETVIYKATGLPAKMMGLNSRGTLEENKFADITIFDEEKIAEKATYSNPMQKPEGIEAVLINGKFVLKDGSITEERPGKALLFKRD